MRNFMLLGVAKVVIAIGMEHFHRVNFINYLLGVEAQNLVNRIVKQGCYNFVEAFDIDSVEPRIMTMA